jgi:hypothetical protein
LKQIQPTSSEKLTEIETKLSIKDKKYTDFSEKNELTELLRDWFKEYEMYKSSLKYYDSFCLTNQTNRD